MMIRYPHRGFTLIEILLAMTLMAIIGVLGFRGLDNVRHASERLSSTAARWQEIALASDRIGRDVRQAFAVPGRTGDGRETPAWLTRRWVDERPESAQLVFSRLGNGDGDVQRIGYRWDKGTSEDAAGGGTLSLLLWSSVDAALPARRYALLDGVAKLELSYLDHQGNWLADWPTAMARQLPRALRLVVTLVEGGVVERIFDVPAAE
ncbi:MAG: type II secretion system minor pseudopilin GspJ [Rhodocyclaceae bacterium]|nr:type II secretion system minor pseudopilin GspJ [Rhodocyclaceae bacterium]